MNTIQELLRRLYVEQGTNYVQAAADKIDALEAENARLREAIGKLVNCKGRYHSEQNYKALEALWRETA